LSKPLTRFLIRGSILKKSISKSKENSMYYKINPVSGWEETFENYEKALERAKEIIKNDEEKLNSVQGYKKAENLIDKVWDNLEEMYANI
jgi:hypothetical protein